MRNQTARILVALIIGIVAIPVSAALGPENLVVVIDSKSPDSVAVGEYYVQKRKVPKANVVRIAWGSAPQRVKWSDFQKHVHDPVLAAIKARGLSERAKMIVLTKGIPYSVDNEAATWMFVAHGPKRQTSSPYYNAQHPLTAFDRFGVGNYPAVIVTGWTVDDAKAVIDRGIASDGTKPKGTVYFMSGKGIRGLRAAQGIAVAAELELMGIKSSHLMGYDIEDKPDVLGYFTGATRVKTKNTYMPGAFADHLTSFGGKLYSKKGQMSILDFIRDGATGSCGTVTEPYALWQKFPRAHLYTAYAKGLTLGEAMWQSVHSPYQVIFVGDPLACPYKRAEPTVGLEKVKVDGVDRYRIIAKSGEMGHRFNGLLLSHDGQASVPLGLAKMGATKVEIIFSERITAGGGGRPGSSQRSFAAVIAPGQPPVAILKELAGQINRDKAYPVKAKVDKGILILDYRPDSYVVSNFRIQCSSVDGQTAAWVPAANRLRFVGQTLPRQAVASIRVSGAAETPYTATLAIGSAKHARLVKPEEPILDVVKGLVAELNKNPKIGGPDGLILLVRGNAKMTSLIIRSKKIGKVWDGVRATLSLQVDKENGKGKKEVKGVKTTPRRGRTLLNHGAVLQHGWSVAKLMPNAVPAGRTITFELNGKKETLTHGGNESRQALLLQCRGLLRKLGPDVVPSVQGGHILLRSNAAKAPALMISTSHADFAAELLGGRWVAMPSFPKPLPKMRTATGVSNTKFKWLAILKIHRGSERLQYDLDLKSVKGLKPGSKLNIAAICDGPWVDRAETAVTVGGE
jgi:uncharacterized protein (TIGR03790 family)